MIVRSVYEGWQVVFHTSHGLLAQRIASQLAEPRNLPFWFETQVAIGLHDDMHRVYEPGKHDRLTKAGAPLDFTLVPMRDDVRAEEMRDRIEEAYRKHTWIGLLQSKHADSLYKDEEVTREMSEMLRYEDERRSKLLPELGVDESQLQRSYDWMGFCDRLSLILCGNDVPAMNRRLEIVTLSMGDRLEIWQDKSGCNFIAPWPFVDEVLKVTIEYRTLEQLSFADDSDLGNKLDNAAIQSRAVKLARPNS